MLHLFRERVDVADGDDETFDSIGEEVFGAGVGGAEDGATAGERLALNEGEPLFNAGENHEMAGAHELRKLVAGDGSEELDLFAGQAREDGLNVGMHGADDAETLCRVTETSEGLKQIRDAFTEANESDEEDFEAVGRRLGGAGEVFEANTVGDNVDLVRGQAHFNEGARGEVGGYGDGVG